MVMDEIKRFALLYEADCSFFKAIVLPGALPEVRIPQRRAEAMPSLSTRTYRSIGGYRLVVYGLVDRVYLVDIYQDEAAELLVTLDWEVLSFARRTAESMAYEDMARNGGLP